MQHPSGETAHDLTEPVWPCKERNSFPVETSHTLTVLSLLLSPQFPLEETI